MPVRANATRKVCPIDPRRGNQMTMRILVAASEMEPFATSGSFGESIASFSQALIAQGHEVSVVLPYYRQIREHGGAKPKRTGVTFSVPLGGGRVPCTICETRAPGGVQVFLVQREEFFDRSGLYGSDEGDYQDNSARFIYFSKCVVELAQRLDPAPDIIHAHSWQAAFVPVMVADQNLPMRTVLSAHSLEFQGNFWSYDFGLTNLPGNYFSPRGMEYYGSMNLLKSGILFADAVVLPGPRWVSEAQTPAFGSGLEPVIRENARKIEGIPNGINLPAKNDSDKAAKRQEWLSTAGFDEDGFLLVSVTDSMISDGMSVVVPALDRLIESGARIAVLGKVSTRNLASMEFAQRLYAGRLAWFPDADDSLVEKAISGSDCLLCAAPVEPNATTFIRAVHQGLIPIAQGNGGLEFLAPTWAPGEARGFGFPFYLHAPRALVDAVRAAKVCFNDSAQWADLVARASGTDYSWKRTASDTEALYKSLLARSPLRQAA